MNHPLRLGVSSSSFIWAMPKELLVTAYQSAIADRVQYFDDRQNAMMVEFMRDIMRVMNTMKIDAMECYHSLAWKSDALVEVILDNPNVEFWSVHAPYGRYIDPSSPEEESREGAVEGYCDAISVGAKLGVKVIVAHPGSNYFRDVPKQTRLEFTIEPFRRIADFAAERGIKVAIEPLPKEEAGNSLEEVLWIIEHVDRPNVGINFDVNHLFPPEAIPDMIRKAGSRIMSIHISDQDGGERHWLPFKGTLNWREVLAALVEVGYTGPLIYETHIREVETCEDVGNAIVENYERLIELAPCRSHPITS